MVGSYGKTETDIAIFWITDTETDTDFWKKNDQKTKTDTDLKTDTDPALHCGRHYRQQLQKQIWQVKERGNVKILEASKVRQPTS